MKTEVKTITPHRLQIVQSANDHLMAELIYEEDKWLVHFSDMLISTLANPVPFNSQTIALVYAKQVAETALSQ